MPRSPEIRRVQQTLKGWRPGVAGSPSAKIQVIDIFSGCGGMSLGFAASGSINKDFRLIGAIDVNERSLETYSRNFNVPALTYDVRNLAESSSLLEEAIGRMDNFDPSLPLVLIGCAPCQGFSAHRKRNWDVEDGRNSLVEAFSRIVSVMRPDVVIMENVPELLSGRYWHYFEAFREVVGASGYRTKQAIHNAAEYGVPQERFRALVMAMKHDRFALPQPILHRGSFLTVRNAIGDLNPVTAGQTDEQDPMHRSANHRRETLEVIRSVKKDGGSRPTGVGPACLDRVAGFSDVYGRLAWDKPSITITHYARNPASGRFVHPDQDRGLTMREVARLQGFPDAFAFTGTIDDVYRQIGEAVPPPMAVAVANSISASLCGDAELLVDDRLISEPINDSFAGVIAGIKSRGR